MSSIDLLTFLEHYERHPCLWSKVHPDYKNRLERDKAEEKLLEISNFNNMKSLRAKIRSIRGTYNNEIRKIRKSMLTCNGEDVYRPKLHWFSFAHNFLYKNLEDEGQTEAYLPLYDSNDAPTEITIEEMKEETKYQIPEEESSSNPSPVVDQPKVLRKRRHFHTHIEKLKRRKIMKLYSSMNEVIQTLKEVQNSVKYNEFTLFGQQVGVQLNKMSLQKALEVQQTIQTILTQARLNDLVGGQSSNSASLSSSNSNHTYL